MRYQESAIDVYAISEYGTNERSSKSLSSTRCRYPVVKRVEFQLRRDISFDTNARKDIKGLLSHSAKRDCPFFHQNHTIGRKSNFRNTGLAVQARNIFAKCDNVLVAKCATNALPSSFTFSTVLPTRKLAVFACIRSRTISEISNLSCTASFPPLSSPIATLFGLHRVRYALILLEISSGGEVCATGLRNQKQKTSLLLTNSTLTSRLTKVILAPFRR
jgi:hypothetical protein